MKVTVVDKNGRQSNIKLNHQNRAELEKLRDQVIKEREEARIFRALSDKETLPGPPTKNTGNFLGIKGGKGRKTKHKSRRRGKKTHTPRIGCAKQGQYRR